MKNEHAVAGAVPEGWKLVPIKPTPKMVDATWNDRLGNESHNTRNYRIYEAMVAAAPIPQHALAPIAARDVLAERRRQVEAEGFDQEHDDAHPNEEIAAYAALYAMPPAARDWPASETGYGDTFGAALCPVDWTPKFGDRRCELVKAAALLLAEIERIDRAVETK